MPRIYKILTQEQWQQFSNDGVFRGAPVDLQDGFIHFSTRQQVRETAMKHFAGQQDLQIVAFETESMEENLRWEKSRNEELFPHLYDELDLSQATSSQKLVLQSDGSFDWSILDDDPE